MVKCAICEEVEVKEARCRVERFENGQLVADFFCDTCSDYVHYFHALWKRFPHKDEYKELPKHLKALEDAVHELVEQWGIPIKEVARLVVHLYD